MTKVEWYIPIIEDGVPLPEPNPTAYTRKIVAGELIKIAEQIKPGQSVILPVGSIGKFKAIVKSRGLAIVQRSGQTDAETRIWVISK